MNTPPSRLTVRRGKSPQSEYTLPEQTVIIGREPINDIMFQELEISRRHASISFREGKHTIEDLKSTNGTFVNGRRISTPVVLTSGDVIDLGDNVSMIYQGGFQEVEPSLQVPSEPTVRSGAAQPERPYAPPEGVPQYSEQAATAPPPTWQSSQPVPSAPAQYDPAASLEDQKTRRNIYIGCGCLLLLAVVGCIASFAYLDSYQGGELLYCQTFRPIWETIFGISDVAAHCG